ncbi:MAG: hypothetical protein ACOCRX_07490 [Candidatus Woesearchaeota archaeon]
MFIHVSEIYNRENILKNGILSSKVKNPMHLKTFQEDGIIDDDKCVYSWVYDENNEKFIRDFVYCRVWIHGRNNIIDEYENFDFSLISGPIYPYNQMIFDVYEINEEGYNPDDYNYTHTQEPYDDITFSTYKMNEEFAHDNKKLFIFNHGIKNFRIVSQCIYYYDSLNDKISIKLKRRNEWE